MSSSEHQISPLGDVIPVLAQDLPLYCPGPKAPLWSMHPRVYLEVAKTGTAVCPYCSTTYQLQDGQAVHGH